MDLILIDIPVLAITLVGASIHGVAGMGLGMTVTPVMVALFGPTEGVLWGNILATTTAASFLIQKYRDVDWGKAARLLVTSIPMIVLTIMVTKNMERAALDLVIGSLVVLMVVFALTSPNMPPAEGKIPIYTTGVIAGVLSATISQAGPIMILYAKASKWEHWSFAATMQAYFLVINGSNIPLKLAVGFGPDDPVRGLVTLAAGVVGMLAGVFISKRIAARIDPLRARNLAMTIATIGAIIVFLRGLAAYL